MTTGTPSIRTGNTVVYNLEASAFDWEIAPGKTVKAWGFNGTLPGPTLRARKGDELVIKVKNNLEEPTIIHWHGIRLPARMDGTESVQQPIAPGEVFEYRFDLPDAGSFWYHSHHNETVQMERGLYGALIVDGDTDPVVEADRVFMLDDMKLTKEGQFYRGGAIGRWKERHDGREGNTILVNGRQEPLIETGAGSVERWRFINAASARYVRLYMGGKEFSVIATDGNYLQKPVRTTELMITPGERYDLLVGPFDEGTSFLLETLPYNRMTFVKSKRATLAFIKVGKQKSSIHSWPVHLGTIHPLAPQDAVVNRKIRFSVGPSWKRGIDFLVNGETHMHDKPVKLGELQVWEVSNTSLMDHPFHLHGFFFQVLEENGKAPESLSWKDTYNLKPRTTIKIAWMPDRTGSWMYHCHILEHHAAGMMGHFEVIAEGEKPSVHAACHK